MRTLQRRDCRSVRDSNLDAAPTTLGAMTRLACGRAEQEGIDVELLLRNAGLTQQQIDDNSTRLDARSQIKFLDLAATALKDDLLGFHLAQSGDLRLMGLLYYVLASSETLEEALGQGMRYSSIVNEGIALKYRKAGDASIRLEYVGISRHSERHQIEAASVGSHIPTASEPPIAIDRRPTQAPA